MTNFYGELIGKSLRKVLEVDVEEDDTGWEFLLRVRVELQL